MAYMCCSLTFFLACINISSKLAFDALEKQSLKITPKSNQPKNSFESVDDIKVGVSPLWRVG